MLSAIKPVDGIPVLPYVALSLIAASHERDVRAGYSAHPRRADGTFAPRQINGSFRGFALTRPGSCHE